MFVEWLKEWADWEGWRKLVFESQFSFRCFAPIFLLFSSFFLPPVDSWVNKLRMVERHSLGGVGLRFGVHWLSKRPPRLITNCSSGCTPSQTLPSQLLGGQALTAPRLTGTQATSQLSGQRLGPRPEPGDSSGVLKSQASQKNSYQALGRGPRSGHGANLVGLCWGPWGSWVSEGHGLRVPFPDNVLCTLISPPPLWTWFIQSGLFIEAKFTNGTCVDCIVLLQVLVRCN
jgi:hypothetical protein